jgi:RNA polymerase sigma-70 factor (ECF subfamily)
VERADVEAARSGDARAFEALIEREVDAVYRLALAITADEADARDATQETLIAAWRQLGRLRDPDRFAVWLRRIAVNAARMTLRARRRRGVREIPAVAVGFGVREPSSAPIAARPDGLVLRAALGRLDPDRRVLLALHYLEGRSVAELGEILEVPEGTVKSRLSAARAAQPGPPAAEDPR